jgi:hypothetical protein
MTSEAGGGPEGVRSGLGALAELGEVAGDALQVGDDREQLHASATTRAFEHVDVERPLQQLGPGR